MPPYVQGASVGVRKRRTATDSLVRAKKENRRKERRASGRSALVRRVSTARVVGGTRALRIAATAWSDRRRMDVTISSHIAAAPSADGARRIAVDVRSQIAPRHRAFRRRFDRGAILRWHPPATKT